MNTFIDFFQCSPEISAVCHKTKNTKGNVAIRPTNNHYGGSNYDSLIVRTVAFPVQVAYWTKRSWPPAEIVSHVKFDQWSRDMAVGSCGLVAIHA